MISEPVEALVNISGNEVKEVAVSNNIHMIRTPDQRADGHRHPVSAGYSR